MDTKRPGSGFFQRDIFKDLVQAMRQDDENKFNQILTSENVNVNQMYERGTDFGTLLDLCCQESDRGKYVATLLTRGANPNLINSRTKKGPIHQAAIREDSETIRVLLWHKDTDPNLLDNFGSTALHYACKNNDVASVQEILQRPDTNVNISNRKGKSPLHLILEKEPSSEYIDALKALLSNPQVDLLMTDSDDVTLKQLLEDSYPELAKDLGSFDSNVESSVDISYLFQLLRRNNYSQFLNNVKGNREMLEGNDGSFTLLQYCSEYGLDDITQALLDEGVNPNGTCRVNTWPPIMIASRKGYVSIVKTLVNSKRISFEPINGETVLHCLVNGGYEKQALSEKNIERSHLKCLSYILKKVPRSMLNLNYQDRNGNTALHYAAKLGDQSLVLELLKAGAYVGTCNKLNEPACADITMSTMKYHLDSCIYANDKIPRDEMYALLFNYSCLIPFTKPDSRVIDSNNFIEVSDSRHAPVIVKKTCETDPLIYISKNSELRPLLTHPIFTSYLHLKWYKIQPYFLINLLFYCLFWLCLTYYILAVYGNAPVLSSNSTADGTVNTNANKSEFIVWGTLLILLFVLILREIMQLIIFPLKYVGNPENWLEIGIIGVTIVILFCESCNLIKHQISAVGILISWAELVLLIGKHPSLSTNIEMLKRVSWTFLKFLAWYSILIIAFALCFYSLFKDADAEDNQFQHPAVSIFKTVVMLTGEFDSGSIPFFNYPVTSHVLFVLFVFLIAIVLFNLLNGLAVSDTQAIKAEAELVGYISQAKLISHIEEKLFNAFDCWGFFPKRFNFSNRINLFHEISEGKIRVFPNTGNRVDFDDVGFVKNRKNETDRPCIEFKTVYMDARIVKAARGILNVQEMEKSKDNYLNAIIQKESELKSILKGFEECLSEYRDISWRISQTLK